MGDIAGDDDSPAQRQAGGHRILRQLRQDLAHRLVKIYLHRFAFPGLAQMLRDIFPRVALQLLDPDAVAVNFGFDVAVGGTGTPHPYRAGSAVTRQTDHADIVGKVFAAELRAETKVLRLQQQLLLQLHVAERLAVLVTFGRQAIVVFGGRQLHGLQRRFRRGTADHEGDMVRWTGGSTEGAHLLDEVIFQLRGGDQRFGFLVQIGFVRRAAALGDAEEFVLIAIGSIEIDLRRQVGASVNLFIHIQRRVLRVAQVVLDIGVVHPLRQGGFIAAAGPHALAFFTHDDRGAGVLAGGQNTFGGDIRVAQELQRDVFIVFAGFRIVKDIRHLLLMRRAKHKGGVVESMLRQKGQRLRVNF